MFVDYKSDPHFAMLFQPVDARTGEALDFPVWYADDETSVVRYYEQSGPRTYRRDPATGGAVSIEIKRAIRLVPSDSNPLKDAILRKQEEIRVCNGFKAVDDLKRVCLKTELEALAWKAAYLAERDRATFWMKELASGL